MAARGTWAALNVTGEETLTLRTASQNDASRATSMKLVKLSVLQWVSGVAGRSAVAAQPGPEPAIVDLPKGAVAPAAQIQLTPAQKTAISDAIKQEGKQATTTTRNVPTTPGAPVPPAIQLQMLPDRALAIVPEAKGVQYTIVETKVVLVDPTTMRVVDVISP
jgi:hypothetical protein